MRMDIEDMSPEEIERCLEERKERSALRLNKGDRIEFDDGVKGLIIDSTGIEERRTFISHDGEVLSVLLTDYSPGSVWMVVSYGYLDDFLRTGRYKVLK